MTRLPWFPALLLLVLAATALPGCPADESDSPDAAPPGADAAPSPDAAVEPDAGEPPPTTATGLISVQDQRLHGAAAAGHGLSVRVDFAAPARAPDFDEQPGELTGCKAWLYDVAGDPRPAALDQGVLAIAGTSAPVPAGCRFDAGSYVCPTSTGEGAVSVAPAEPPIARYDLAGAALGPDDVGRHLRVTATAGEQADLGTFPIVAAPSPTGALVVNAGAVAADLSAQFTVLAGGGAPGVPLDSPADPLADGDAVVVGLEPGGGGQLAFPDSAPIDVGDAFELDTASDAQIGAIPVDGTPFSLGCDGAGGRCGEAFASIIQLETTDADLTDASPFALPPAASKTVVIQCASIGQGRIDVPAGATDLLRRAHADRPITRVRVAFMRDGFALVSNPPPGPANPVRIVVGHQLVAFTTVMPAAR